MEDGCIYLSVLTSFSRVISSLSVPSHFLVCSSQQNGWERIPNGRSENPLSRKWEILYAAITTGTSPCFINPLIKLHLDYGWLPLWKWLYKEMDLLFFPLSEMGWGHYSALCCSMRAIYNRIHEGTLGTRNQTSLWSPLPPLCLFQQVLFCVVSDWLLLV